MKILWFTWKDKKNPLAGGAEIVNDELAKRLAGDGHEVIFLVAGFDKCLPEEIIDGYKIVRLGNRWTVYFAAWRYYRRNFQGWADVVIDEVNTIPFMAKFYVRERNILFVHQLCRQIWFYEMFFPLSLIGYLLEPIYLWLLRDRRVITVSESTKNDLLRFGFKKENIEIISEGIEIKPIENLDSIVKFPKPTILAFGALRSMKRTLDIVKAFEIAKQKISDLELVIAGSADNKYGQKVLNKITTSPHRDSIKYLGKVSLEKKIELMQKSHVICVTSVKEGWGLIVTEANSQGIPAVVYDVDGLRDCVKYDETGMICDENNSVDMAASVVEILSDKIKYQQLRLNGLKWSKEINFEKSYRDFIEYINLIK